MLRPHLNSTSSGGMHTVVCRYLFSDFMFPGLSLSIVKHRFGLLYARSIGEKMKVQMGSNVEECEKVRQ